MSGQLEHLRGWSRGCTPPQECCRLPPSYFWTTWHQTRAFLISMKNGKWFSGWFDNLEKVDMSGHFERLRGWSAVALRLRNAADYCLPTFGPHITKLEHSWYQWKIKSDFLGWFDNSKKGDVFGHCRCIGGWSCACTPPKECCRLPPTYFWTTWHQTRAFLISVNNKKWFFWLVWQFWKRRGVWAL